MRPLAYSYKVDEVGFIWPLGPIGADGPFARFTLSGIWPQSFGMAQAPRSAQRDLLRVAAAIAAADRLSRRQPAGTKETKRQLHWQRDIRLQIAVETPDRWRHAANLATTAIEFLTADHWKLEFDPITRPSIQSSLIPEVSASGIEVALFSGGLDSGAGLLARHLENQSRFAAVSVSGTSVRGAAQRNVIRHLQREGVEVHWLPLEHQIRRDALASGPGEMPRRSRGFLFLAVGAAVASVLGARDLFVYETGIGALNIRATAGQLAAQTTRAVHPRTLLLMECLLSQVLDDPISIQLPFLFRTKGELCRTVGTKLARLADVTMSCDEGEGHKPESMQHCGLCTSCLFRRVALHRAGDPTSYRCEAGRTHDGYDLAAFEMQALRIQEWKLGFDNLLDADPDARYAIDYAVRRGQSRETATAALVEAYQRYAREVAEFIRCVRPGILPAILPSREVQRAFFTRTR